jgi:hypothetical protein
VKVIIIETLQPISGVPYYRTKKRNSGTVQYKRHQRGSKKGAILTINKIVLCACVRVCVIQQGT